jgi:zinc protease
MEFTCKFYQKRPVPMSEMKRQPCLGALVLALVLVLPQAVLANPFEHRLANGLRLIVKEDRRAPTVVHMVWYRAGSMDETNGTTGVAHVLEHMMFKGTPATGPGEFSRQVAAAGGRIYEP